MSHDKMSQIIPHSKTNHIVTRWEGEWKKFQIVTIKDKDLITACGKIIPRNECIPAKDNHRDMDLIIPWAMGAIIEQRKGNKEWSTQSSPHWIPQRVYEYRTCQISDEQWDIISLNEEIKNLEKRLEFAKNVRRKLENR